MKLRIILKNIVLVIILFSMYISCEKDKNDNHDIICGTTDPLEELEWLKNLINDLENAPNAEIYLYTYKKEEKVFLIAYCAGCPDGVAEVYDCDGNVICVFGGFSGMNTCPDFDSLAVKDSLIWKNYGQSEIDSINNILVGNWIWSECIPAPFDCFEQPSVSLSRSIDFFEAPNDSLFYKTYKNDSLREEGKIRIEKNTFSSWLIKEDIVFGDSIYGTKYNEHDIVIENDTTIKIMLGNYKSSLVYKYGKKMVLIK